MLFISIIFHIYYLTRYVRERTESYLRKYINTAAINIFIGGTPDLIDENKDVVFKTSIIGYDVTVGGTANLSITYEKDMDYSVPASMQLIQ